MTVTDRTPLTRQRIADRALALIDENGFEGLSMRKLGAALGVEAMSLYNHVSNKEDLLDAVTDELYVKIIAGYGEPVGDWRVKARQMAGTYVRVAEEHPNAIPLLVERRVSAGSGQDFMNRVVSIFDDVTEDMHVAALAFSVASSWVVGTLVQENSMVSQLIEGAEPEEFGSNNPALSRFRRAYAELGSSEERVLEGLEAVLDGIGARYFST